MTTEQEIQTREVEATLSVLEWNVVISALRPVDFAESNKILEAIAEGSKDTKAKGAEPLTIKMTNIQVGQILNVVQMLPYNVVARIIGKLFTLIQEETSEQK